MKTRKRVNVDPVPTPEESVPDAVAKADEGSSSVDDEIVRISEQLNERLRPKVTFEFPKLQQTRGLKPLRGDLDQIVETVWVEDMYETWKRIKASLRVGERRSEHGFLQRALDNARKLSYDAHRLFITSKMELERWELDNEVVFSAMWNDAMKSLQMEKDTGLRSKQITDADVRARVATLYPDEWSAQEKKRKRIKLTVDNISQLSKEANEHCSDLQVMLSKLRG